MTTPAKQRGYSGNVYRNTNTPGSDGTPQTWSQVANAEDIKVADTWKTFMAMNRVSPVEKYLNAVQNWSVEFKIVWDRTDADLLAMQTAYRAGSPIALFVSDGGSAESGASGPYADWLITDFGRDMPLTAGQTITVKCVPHANCRFEPQYLAIS